MRFPGSGALAILLGTAYTGSPPEPSIGTPHHVAVSRVASFIPPASLAVAGRLVTAEFWSQSLGARKRVVAWLPPSYDANPQRRYPVALYLHGLGGEETDWSRRGNIAHALDSLATTEGLELIVVMPDGDDSWYTTWNWLGDYAACRRDFTVHERRGDTVDSYCVPWPHYDDYIARDLVAYVDRTWRTDPRRERRGIAGLSMGGFGAMTLGFAYPDVFGAIASHSGVLSPLYAGPKPFFAPPRYANTALALEEGWGPRLWPLLSQAFGKDTSGWYARDPARRGAALWQRARSRMPALFVDIGTDDTLLDQNRAFRWELQRLGIPHEYREWPGGHDWEYWSRHVHESLRFLSRQIAR